MVLTYKTLHDTTSAYICDMLNWYHPSRPLRSGDFPSLTPNHHKTSIMYGRRLCDTATLMKMNIDEVGTSGILLNQMYDHQMMFTLIENRS